jgi:hypothetical protein
MGAYKVGATVVTKMATEIVLAKGKAEALNVPEGRS